MDLLRTISITEYEYKFNDNNKIKPDVIMVPLDAILFNRTYHIKVRMSNIQHIRGLSIVECKRLEYFIFYKDDKLYIRDDKIQKAAKQVSKYLKTFEYNLPVYLLLGIGYLNHERLSLARNLIEKIHERILKELNNQRDIVNTLYILLASNTRYSYNSSILFIEFYKNFEESMTRTINSLTNIDNLLEQIRVKLNLAKLDSPIEITLKQTNDPHTSLLIFEGRSGNKITAMNLTIKMRQ